jgi:hypothetical protein
MRPKMISIVSGLVMAFCSAAVFAQTPAAPPKPGPETKKLAPFVGKWTSTGELPKDAMGPGTGGKITGTETCEWVSGGFALLCRDAGEGGGMGKSSGVGVLAYDPEAKTYTYSGVDSSGMVTNSHGSVSGDTWTWTTKGTMNGQPMEMRYTIKWTSKDAYEFKFEGGPDANSLKVMMEGKQTRVTVAKPAGTKPSSE